MNVVCRLTTAKASVPTQTSSTSAPVQVATHCIVTRTLVHIYDFALLQQNCRCQWIIDVSIYNSFNGINILQLSFAAIF